RFLLLLNILEDNKLERKFDFSIWGNRSLEHIFPKSKLSLLDFDKDVYIEGSIHCIGNLVLLYGKDNSSFGAKDFLEKKNTYFNTSSSFSSRNLLHTISVFSKSDWKEKEIISNKILTIKQITDYYGIR
ncbi:MAG: HNH endonuclease family protein, partial [Chryseobacterium sp.]